MRIFSPLPGFNVRGYSYSELQPDGQRHPGADLNIGAGDEDLGLDVCAFADGVIVARRNWDGRTFGLGNALLVEHDLGSLKIWTLYAHLDSFDDVAWPGTPVVGGQRLGTCGKTGFQAWAHLHFEIRLVELDILYWGGRLPIDQLQRMYADPYSLLKLAEAINVDPAPALEHDCGPIESARQAADAIKAEFELYLRDGKHAARMRAAARRWAKANGRHYDHVDYLVARAAPG